MNTFLSNITEIISVMADPSSYIETTSKSSKTESFESTMAGIVKKYNNQQIKQKHITPIIEILKKIIPTEIKVDYSDLLDYFVKVKKFQKNSTCNCYVRNLDKLDKYTDDDVVKSSELFLGFHCKTCGHFDSEHKACKKYVHTDDYWCETCGITKSSHTVCMNYDGIVDNCNSCGFDWHEHQNKYDGMKIEDCRNFVPHSEYTSRCSNCIFNDTHHKYTKKYHSLNDKTKSQVADLWFHITVDFISMTETERMQYYNQFYMLTQIITNSL
jgi:hypothetical protein